MHTQTLGEAIVAHANAHRRRSGIDQPTDATMQDQVPLAGAAARTLMARHMREIEAASGGVTEAELRLKGWSEAEIAEHGAAAAHEASRDSERRSF